MLLGAVLLQFSVVGLVINAFSVYLPYLLEHCELSNTESSAVVMIRSGAAAVSMLFVGKIYEKLELRMGITLAVGLSAVAVFLYAAADSFWQMILAAVVAGTAYGMGGMYAVSLLIHRWFRKHEPLALGICTATTGLATVIGAPVSTALVEFASLSWALRTEAIFLAVCAAGCCLLIRNRPDDLPCHEIQKREKHGRFRFSLMHAAVLVIGSMGNTAFQFLALHFSAQGLESFQISAVVSAVGLSLMCSKFLFGAAVDRWGAYKTNWLFFGLTIGGTGLCTFADSFAAAMAAVVPLGLGLAFATVGLTVYAEDLYAAERFGQTVREFQLCYLLGGMLSNPLAGAIADWTGSYVLFYAVQTVLCILALAVLQSRYHKNQKAMCCLP